MRIVVIAPGSRGDVEPYVALSKGLTQAGHVVRLVTHEDFYALVTSHGVDCWPVEGSVQEVVQGADMRERLAGGKFMAVMSQMAKEAQQRAVQFGRVGLAACQGMELVLAGVGGVFVGLALAERLGLPLLQAYYIPFTPTRAYPSFLLPKLPRLPGLPNLLSHHLARQSLCGGKCWVCRPPRFGDRSIPAAFATSRSCTGTAHLSSLAPLTGILRSM
jgi:sterol 3beta-glucosyltransferase